MQLEKYCATLLSNSVLLCSSWKSDATGTLCDDALREILLSIRKCCDHPYLLDQSLQNFVTDDLPIDEILDVGKKASGKLQLLDKMLLEIKSRGLRVLVIYQILGGSGLYSIGDYLDDIVCQRFGRDTYIRIEGGGGYDPKKKKDLLNTFNQDRKKFVLLIENRACIRSVKLSSVDTVILFNSDLDPVNDLRALQRIAIDSPVEELKVFRLYSPYTIEEKALILAKEGATPDSHINNIHRKTCHMLLTWGAASLFNKLDKFHGLNISISGSNIFLESSLVNEVLGEFSTLCSNENGDTSHCSVISKVQHINGVYSRNILLHSEGKTQLVDGNETHVLFWKDLLEARHPQWKILPRSSEKNRRKLHFFDSSPNRPESESSPKRFGFRSVTVRRKRRTVVNWSSQRSRRKVKYFDSSPTRSDSESDVVRKKSRKLVNWSCQRTRLNVNLFDGSPKQRSEFGSLSKGSGFGSEVFRKKCKVSSLNDIRKSVPVTKDISRVPEVSMDRYEEGRLPKESAQSSFKPEISKLCRILHLPKNVEAMALRFLEYVMREYDIGWEEETTFQAFQISVCWAAASFSKHRVDRIDSLALAKLHLNFDCQEEETNYIYSKMRKLKKKFACHIECVERASKSIQQKEDDQKRNTCSDQPVPAINEEAPDSTMVERNNVEPPHIEEPADVLDFFSMQSARDIPLVGSVASVSESELDLLDIEIKRIQKDKEQTIKLHEDMKLQLELECAKEIEGIRALIGKKYDVLLKDAENEFVQKKKDLATYYDKVLLNKSLAETWATYHDNSEIDMSTNMQPATTSDFIDRLIPQTRERQAPRLEQSLVSSPKIVKAPPVQVVNQSSELFSNGQDRLGALGLPMSVPNQQLQSYPHATSSRPTQLYTATNQQLLQSNPLATSSMLTQLNRLLAQHSLPVGINTSTPAANLPNPFSPLNDIFSSPRKKPITNSNK